MFGPPESEQQQRSLTEVDYYGGLLSEVFGPPESEEQHRSLTEVDYYGGPLSEVFGPPESEEQQRSSTEVGYHGGPLSEVFDLLESGEHQRATTEMDRHGGPVSEVSGPPEATASLGGAAMALASADATSALTTEPATSGTVPSAAPIRGAIGGRESSTGTVSSDAEAEASPSTGGTAAPVASAAKTARKLASVAGSAGEICGERGASTHPFDPGPVFPLEARYSSVEHAKYNSSGSSSSSSSSSSNDYTRGHDSWCDTTCVGALLRPFDPGKRYRQSARRGKAVLGVDLPFDRRRA